MLQFDSLDARIASRLVAQARFESEPLEALADQSLLQLREERKWAAQHSGVVVRVREALDRALRTEEVEYLDRPDIPTQMKIEIVSELHKFNRKLRSYERWFSVLEPLLRRINERKGRPARLLELACGHGEFTLRCSEMARDRGLQIEPTGSDVVAPYLEASAKAAKERGIKAEFRRLNAFAMDDVADGAYDVAFIGQSIHHFTAGQVARMIAECRRTCTTAFVGVDGRRSLITMGVAPVYGFLATGSRAYAHDSIVSTRKFYSDSELRMIAELSARGAPVEVRRLVPGYTALVVTFLP